jgi:ATP-dependent DNA helicase RecQ
VTKRLPVQLRPLTAEERQLIELLRNWRKQVADRERVPTYLICQDKTFEHLVILRPRTVEELVNIFGLGPVKIAKYGAELIAQLTEEGSRE